MNVPAPPAAGQSRYDIIEVRPRRDLADYGQLLRFDQAVNNFVPKVPLDTFAEPVNPGMPE